MNGPQPSKIQLDKPHRRLVIFWNDGFRHDFPWELLRARCPSAEEPLPHTPAGSLSVLKGAPSHDVVDVRMVGAYALSITWGDGHSSGIYTWEYLRELGDDPMVETHAIA